MAVVLTAAIFALLSAAELILIVYLRRYRVDRLGRDNPLDGPSVLWALNVFNKANYSPPGQQWMPRLAALQTLQALAGLALVCAVAAR
jgi:hypothetical protein